VKARLAASIALASALLVGTSACTLYSINGTLKPYQPSDGAGATIGELKVRNILGLSESGEDVALVFSIVNESDSDETVKLQFTDGDGDKQDVELTVPAGESLPVGHTADDQLVLRGADATVGGTIPIYFSYDDHGDSIAVPVLDGSQLEYSDLLPGPAPKPSPSVSAVAEDAEAE
jgi:hypothetical protein